jgi:hypothetical protein
MRPSLRLLLLVSVLPRCLSAQTLAERVGVVKEGTVRLSYAARPGVCGEWASGIGMRQDNDEWQADAGLDRFGSRCGSEITGSTRFELT